jgi:hypothetical protein
VFLPTRFGKRMPVTWTSLNDEDRMLISRGLEVPYRHGEHISHFADCTHADRFRGQAKLFGEEE